MFNSKNWKPTKFQTDLDIELRKRGIFGNYISDETERVEARVDEDLWVICWPEDAVPRLVVDDTSNYGDLTPDNLARIHTIVEAFLAVKGSITANAC